MTLIRLGAPRSPVLLFATLGVAPALLACQSRSDAPRANAQDPEALALPAFEAAALSAVAFRAHVSALAHDSMQGRAPGTVGGEKAERSWPARSEGRV